MTVKSILSLAAANLGRGDLVAAVNDCAQEPCGEVASLLRCYNLVENEIALDYFPLKTEESILSGGGVVPYARLQHAPVTILSVTGENGIAQDFEVRPAQIVLMGDQNRQINIVYTYSPAEKRFTDDCELGGNISARLLSFGVACEFCLSNGQFAEAATWEKKYREALRAANSRRRPLSVRSRRWV